MKILKKLLAEIKWLGPALDMRTSPHLMKAQLLMVFMTILWTVYPSAKTYGTVENAIGKFAIWSVYFHFVAYVYRSRLSQGFVRSLDYWYLSIGFIGVLLKLHEFNIHSQLISDRGAIVDLVNLFSLSPMELNHIGINMLVVAIALRITKTSIELFRWHQQKPDAVFGTST